MMPTEQTREEGFTIVELMAAVSVLAVGFFSLASAMGIGLRQVALARQRQSATEIANGQLESLRNFPYGSVALSDQPVHSTDSSDPDHAVSTDGTMYDIPGPSAGETLLVDSVNGRLVHKPAPAQVGATLMDVYQYVTWHDDPGIAGTQNYKRVTIVVAFRAPAITGPIRTVSASAFVTTGEVIVIGTGAGPTQGSSSPSPAPSPTPSSGPCTGDTTAPDGDFTMSTGSGAETGYTASTSVTVQIALTDPCGPVTAAFSFDGVSFGSPITMTTASESVVIKIADGDGTKNVWGRFSDGLGNTKTTGPQTIVLDTVKPTTPGTLTFTKSCSGNNRTVNLSWGASTDANFHGYRIYRSINNASWVELLTVSTTTASDTHPKTHDSVRFYSVAYDKAGNESLESNTIQLTRNQC